MSEVKLYDKVCKYCGKEFKHESRNKRYCCDECSDKAQEKRIKHNRTKARKRKEYHESREANVLLSRTYKVAHAVAELFLVKECGHDHEADGTECKGKLELHHKDLNPFNNSPDNLVWLCGIHSVIHTKQPDVNMVTVIDECLKTDDKSAKFKEIMDAFPIDKNLF